LLAVEDRNVERAVELLKHHLNRGVEVITRYLNSPEALNKKTPR
jgi:DNA-binding GntR family transcriptional regulator